MWGVACVHISSGNKGMDSVPISPNKRRMTSDSVCAWPVCMSSLVKKVESHLKNIVRTLSL